MLGPLATALSLLSGWPAALCVGHVALCRTSALPSGSRVRCLLCRHSPLVISSAVLVRYSVSRVRWREGVITRRSGFGGVSVLRAKEF